VIFDDAQRCDRVGADQLGRHITDARARRAVVLVACRSGEARATDPWWPERLRGDPSAVTVRLGPLSERSVGVLLGDRASVWRAGARRPGPGRARRRRGPPPQADPTRPRQPHRSERSVAALAAAGRRNHEIGSELYVTLNTVSTHLRSVYRKLNISSRAQLPAHFGPAARP